MDDEREYAKVVRSLSTLQQEYDRLMTDSIYVSEACKR
jgi:hypothetical protein